MQVPLRETCRDVPATDGGGRHGLLRAIRLFGRPLSCMTKNQRRLTVTVEEAGALLGVGRSTAYELVRSGDLPCIRLRRRIVVPVGRLADHLGISVNEILVAVSGVRNDESLTTGAIDAPTTLF